MNWHAKSNVSELSRIFFTHYTDERGGKGKIVRRKCEGIRMKEKEREKSSVGSAELYGREGRKE